jgi:hypothetical protein
MDNENNEMNENNEKKKLTDLQLRIVQGIAGILSAAALIASIYISGLYSQSGSQNILLEYLFIIVFVVIIFVRRRVETKFRIRMNFYNLILIDGILAGILIYFTMAFEPKSNFDIDPLYKILIAVGIGLIIIGLGILFPLMRYRKRMEKGTIVPIRIPEPTEEEAKKEGARSNRNASAGSGRSITQQIAEMTKELEGSGPDINPEKTGDESGSNADNDIESEESQEDE